MRVVIGDGSEGLLECAPFGAIVVSAAAPSVPALLFDQCLMEGMVIPVGPSEAQELQLFRNDGQAIVGELRDVVLCH